MNVDVLSNNPSWIWYVGFAVPFMGLVLLGWILFKYIPVCGHLILVIVKYSQYIRLRNGLRTTSDHASNGKQPPLPEAKNSPASK